MMYNRLSCQLKLFFIFYEEIELHALKVFLGVICLILSRKRSIKTREFLFRKRKTVIAEKQPDYGCYVWVKGYQRIFL